MLGENGTENGRGLELAYIVGTYPLLTTTFIDREIRLLRQWGVGLRIISIRRPRHTLSPEQDGLREGVYYLLPFSIIQLLASQLWFLLARPLAYWRVLFFLLTRPHRSWRSRVKTVLHFGEGVYAAYRMRLFPSRHIHAHFVDRAATVALVASRLLKIPYSVTAHANDIYVDPVLLPEKMAGAKFVATCTKYNKSHLSQIEDGHFRDKLRCIYHGLDVERYQPQPASGSAIPGLVAVGQLKEKKGFTYLLQACRLLKDWGYIFRCQIVGEGPLRQVLETQIADLELEDVVALCGALPHQEVIDKYRESDIFVLPCVLGSDGDRDGIPNVILEAMAMALPVVSTRHSGIPEVVENGRNGLLVPPADETPLAEALASLMDDPARRQKLGQNGRETVVETFALERNVRQLLQEFQA